MQYFSRLLVVALLLPALSFAQANFKPGYIVTLKGDTIRGAVNYREWNINPAVVEFKHDNEVKKYQPSTVAGFGADNLANYQSQVITVSSNEINLNKLTHVQDTASTRLQTFLRVITTGQHVTLFNYTDRLKERFYISHTADKQPMELIYRPYLRTNDGQIPTVIEDKAYQLTLSRLAYLYHAEDAKTLARINSAFYNKADLVKAVNSINKLSSAAANMAGSKQSSFRFFAGLAALQSHLTFTVESPLFRNPSQNYFMPQLNTGFDLVTNKATGKIVLRLEFSASTTKFIASTDKFKLEATQVNIGVTPQAIYNFHSTEKLKIYGAGGVSVVRAIYPRNYVQKDFQLTSTISFDIEGKYAFQRVRMAFPFKAGVVVNNALDVYATYFIPTNVDRFRNFDSLQHIMGVGVNYLFGKQ